MRDLNALDARGVLAFGPRREPRARIVQMVRKVRHAGAGVAHAAGELFESSAAAHKWVEYLGDHPDYLPVLKADGLAAGKGVIVPADLDEAHQAVRADGREVRRRRPIVRRSRPRSVSDGELPLRATATPSRRLRAAEPSRMARAI